MSYPDQIGMETAFLVGMCGAFVIYSIRYRLTRFEQALSGLQIKWPQLIFDILLFIVCGGLVACLFVCATTIKEAFQAGIAWDGLILSTIEGAKLHAKT